MMHNIRIKNMSKINKEKESKNNKKIMQNNAPKSKD